MTKNNKRKSLKILSLLFASCLACGSVSALAACDDGKGGDVDDSKVNITKKDDSRIENGSFEFYDNNEGKSLIVSSNLSGWSAGLVSSSKGNAPTSSVTSGIIDTSAENWEKLTATSDLPHATKEEAEENWDNLTLKDQLEFLHTWQEEDKDNDIKDLSFYDEDADIFNYNISFPSLPTCANPGTPVNGDEETSVLMIHNKHTDGYGTAQKYTSGSTVTLQPGLSAKVTLSVKTDGLQSAGLDALNYRGAFVSVSQTVGGKAMDEVKLKNINTRGVWKDYTFYVTASSYAQTTFSITLGLGQNNGTNFEYVEGYAFFDNVNCTLMKTSALTGDADKTIDLSLTAEDRVINLYDKTNHQTKADSKFHIDLSKSATASSIAFSSIAQTTEKNSHGDVVNSGIATTAADQLGYLSVSELASLYSGTQATNKFKTYYEKSFANYPFAGNMLLLYSETGAPYTATAQNITVASGEFFALSFWVKTSDFTGGYIGAGVSVKDVTGGVSAHGSTALFTSLSVYDVDGVEIDKADGSKQEDVFNGWQQCFILLGNDTQADKHVQLSFTYGPTAIATTAASGYRAGFAAFANFEKINLDEKEFDNFAATAHGKKHEFTEEGATELSKFDDAVTVPTDKIKTGFANAQNFSGVVGGSKYTVWNGTEEGKNTYEYAGLLRTEFLSNYSSLLPAGATMNLASALDGATQPLVIYNNAQMAYGYIGNTETITAASLINVRVKASVGAKAYVYLVEKTEAGYTDAMGISTLGYTYWYNADGNICSEDPTDPDYDPKHDVALKRADNGLYVVNKYWRHYSADMEGKQFANLQNYEKDPSTGNLLVAKDGVTYNYDADVWKHAGNNGIAFYAKDAATEEYYAYETKLEKDRVYDLSTLTQLTPRYADNQKSDVLSMEIVGNGEWIDCWFYVNAGNKNKEYRLEVWSGSRDSSVKNAADSWVVFDRVERSLDTADFTAIRDLKLDLAMDAYADEDAFKAGYAGVAYTTFSFFDSPTFLRYDSSLDKEKVGNAYDDYDATEHQEGIAFFAYNQTNGNGDVTDMFKFFDYSVVDVQVDPDKEGTTTTPDDDGDEDKPGDGTNVWMLASSIILAAALLLAIVSLIVRKIMRKHRRKAAAKKLVRVSARKAKKEKQVVVVPEEEQKDEDDPYND